MSTERTQTRSATGPTSEERDRTTTKAPYQFDPDSRSRLPPPFAGD